MTFLPDPTSTHTSPRLRRDNYAGRPDPTSTHTWSRLRRVPTLRGRLIILLAVPLVVVTVVAGLAFSSAADASSRARAAAREIELSLAASNAALQLSHERHLSVNALSAPDGASLPDELVFQRGKTSEAMATLESVVERRPSMDRLGRLDSTRDAVDDRSPNAQEVLDTYSALIDPVLDLDHDVEHVDDAELVTQLTSHHALTRAIQDLAHERSLLASAFSTAQMGQPTYDQLLALSASEVLWLDQFEDNASSEQVDSYQEASDVPAVETAQRLRQSALDAGPGGVVGNAELEVWSSAMGRRIDLLERIAEDTANDLTTAADRQRAAASQRQLVALGWLAGAVALTLGLGLVLYRFVIRPLRELSSASRSAANKTLPAAVEQAQREGPESLRRAFAPLEPPREHELRELAGAFNTVQESAAALATSEAASKGNAGAVYLNFGRRTQNLVSRQLGHIDDLEARTDDPDTLSDLFLLDHLATRLRRTAESLVVLAGADSPRRWSRPVTVVNVVRAAAAEAADYSRVDLESMAGGSVLGATANDISHLLAELVDNALAFSPPDCRVTLGGSWEPDGRYLVTVTDAGPGMSPQLLAATNQRLAHVSASDPEASHYFGLFVVARFAQRHGVEVELVPARPRGTTARVLLPASLTVQASASPGFTGARPRPTADADADDPPGASVTVLQAATWPSG